MRLIMEAVERRAAEFARHPLFAFLEDTSIPAGERLGFIPLMSHFVMTFADLYSLVLREEPARDRFQEIVNAHTFEDGGHWKWFLADLDKVDDSEIRLSEALRFVWSDACLHMRLLSYHMCRLGFQADSLQKLVLVQCIEASGAIVLERASHVGREWGELTGRKLVYFGPHHFESESNHTIEQDDVSRTLRETALDPLVSKKMAAIVDECFDLFQGCADDMRSYACARRVAVPVRRELRA